MNPIHKLPIPFLVATSAASILFTSTTQIQAQTTIDFLGGDLALDANWDGGLQPGAGEVGLINVDATLAIGNILGGWISGDPELIIDNGAIITITGDWGHTNVLSSTINNGILNISDDIFANNSAMIFNAGSVTNVTDDFEANGGAAAASSITINGGTHTVGDSFGLQGANTLTMTGGIVTAGRFRVDAAGSLSLDGAATLIGTDGSTSGTDDLSRILGSIDIASTWTGSWTISTLTGTDWETEVTGGDWTLDGALIDATVFTDNFEVSNGGTALSLISESSPPSIIALAPANGATSVPSESLLVATFNESIALGDTGTITIENLTNPSTIEITLPGPDPDGTVTVSGNQLTITPTSPLAGSDQLAIQVQSSVVEDLEGNPFLGINDNTSWSFTVIDPDVTAPTLVSTTPNDDANNVNPNADLVATFDEEIFLGASGTVTITNLTNPGDIVITIPGPDPNGTLTAAGTDLTIELATNLIAGDEYSVEISPTVVEDEAGNTFAGLLNSDVPNWTFTTDGTAPSNTSTSPLAGATDVLVFSSINLSFSEVVQAGVGSITLGLVSDGSVVEVIDITSPNVVINGGTITITPSADLVAGTSYFVTITPGAIIDPSGNPFLGISDNTAFTFSTESGELVLFSDSFNRANNTDLNASTDGMTGSLAPINWVEVNNAGEAEILSNEFNFGETSAGGGGGWSVTYLDHNFVDPAISIGSGFDVSVDLVNANSAGGTRFMGLIVGHSQTELDEWSSNNPNSNPFDSDFFVGIDPTGTNELEIFTNGTVDFQTNFTLSPPQTLNVVFSEFSDFNAGSSVSYEVFIDDTSINSGSFTWSGTNENYLGLFSNYTSTQAVMDNFVVRSNVAIADDLELCIAQVGNTLEFEWNSMSGMQYDLVSDTDLSSDPSTWLPYNDGVITYQNIVSTGTGTQTLTNVLKVGPTRFFALIENEIQPLLDEDFEDGDGGFTISTGVGTEWAFGEPNSTSPGGIVNEGNAGSTNCWGTNLGNPDNNDFGFYLDPTTDSCLRSPVIDLTGVTGAELTFAHAIDLETVGDSVTLNIIDDTTDTVIAASIINIVDEDVSLANWQPIGPITIPDVALGQPVRIEWCLSGTGGSTDDYLGWYIDDVMVTATDN